MRKFAKIFVLALVCLSALPVTGCKKEVSTVSDGNAPTIQLFTPFDAGTELKSDTWVIKKWGEEVGANIEVQSCNSDVFSEKIAAVFAGGNFPDIINYYGDEKTYDKYGDRLFLDTNKAMKDGKMPNLKSWYDKFPEIKAAMTNISDGGIYGLPQFREDDFPYSAWTVREDLLKKAGTSSKPIMTIDELKDMMLALKKVSGQPYVTSSRLGWTYFAEEIGYIFGCAPYMTYDNKWSYSTNTFVYGPTEPAYKTWVEFMRWMYENQILHPSFATMTTQELNAGYAEGKFQVCMEQTSMVGNALRGNDEKYPGREEAAIIGLNINGEIPKQATMPHYNIGRRWPATITKSSKNLDKAIEAMDWLYSEEGNTLVRYGEEGVHWKKDDRFPTGRISLLNGNYDIAQKLKKGEITQEEYDAVPKAADFGIGSHWLNAIQSKDQMRGNPCSEDPIALAAYEFKANTRQAMYDQGIAIEADPLLKFTDEEEKEINDILIPLETYLSEQTTKFIMGSLSMDKWDEFQAQMKSMGSERLEEIYNNRYNESYK